VYLLSTWVTRRNCDVISTSNRFTAFLWSISAWFTVTLYILSNLLNSNLFIFFFADYSIEIRIDFRKTNKKISVSAVKQKLRDSSLGVLLKRKSFARLIHNKLILKLISSDRFRSALVDTLVHRLLLQQKAKSLSSFVRRDGRQKNM
jgi:hypothetical protein